MPFRAVCVNANGDPSGENAPGEWIASGSLVSGQLAAAPRVEAGECVPLVAADVAGEHEALVDGARHRRR